MLKKKQLVLILLTLVLMLSVYYIRSPFNKSDENNEPNDGSNNQGQVVTGRLEQLQELRSVLTEERAAQVLSLDAIIADSSKSVEEINSAISEKRYINGLTEKELLLETQILNKGYQDCFVHASETGIEITVVSSEVSKSKANEIIVMALSGFDSVNSNISVDFQTVEQVMGTI